MKKSIKISLFFIGLLIAGVLTSADAQRGNQGRGGYRGDYGRGYRNNDSRFYRGGGNYARTYRNDYYRGYRNSYSYRPPVMYRGNYSPYFGPRYYGVPRGSVSISFGGNPYFYFGGTFYRPFSGYYRSVFPPVGLRIGLLPTGYVPINVGPDPYYFYNGSYYRRYDERNYEVVDAPMGAQLSSLPEGAKSVTVNGEKFYELNGTYYKEDRDTRGNRVYTVVGKNGEVENTQEIAESSLPKIGDSVADLPANCKTITLNGEKLFVAPDDTYFKQESDGSYTVVGVAGTETNSNASSGY